MLNAINIYLSKLKNHDVKITEERGYSIGFATDCVAFSF